MQEFDSQIFTHRFYHEAPNDIFEIFVKLSSELDAYGSGRGVTHSLNARDSQN